MLPWVPALLARSTCSRRLSRAGHERYSRPDQSGHLRHRDRPCSPTTAFHIAVLARRRHRAGGHGARARGAAPVEATTPGLKFRFSEAPAGAGHYRDTGKSMPESTIKLCEEADAILLGACGLPHIRYPDGTEIMPQVELRFIFDLYAGVRPCRLIPGIPSPIVGAAERGIDLVVIRESTEGLFASMGKGVVDRDRSARDPGDHAQDLASGCSTSRSARARAQGARRPGASPASTRRTRSRPTPSSARCSTNAPRASAVATDHALRRRLLGHAGAPALGLRRHGDGEHVRRHPLRSRRRPDRRHGHGAVRRHRRRARGVPALPRHRPRHHGQGWPIPPP